jgi:hypothetical protein
MFNEIKAVILAGGSVKFPWKSNVASWYSELSISNSPYIKGFQLDGEPFMNLKYKKLDVPMVNGEFVYRFDLDEAVRIFGRTAFGKENIAVAFEGIKKHGLSKRKNFDSLSQRRLRELVRKYFDEFYDQDYPFINEFKE